MKKLCIFGAGGFAKEVFWLARQCGKHPDAFIDVHSGGSYCGTNVETNEYFDPQKHTAVIAIGDPNTRKKVVNQIITRYGDDVEFETLIHPTANIMGDNVIIGKGSVICANCILTCNIELGPWSQLNLSTTIGHDTTTGAFFTTAPGAHISGKVKIGNSVYFGTNASTIENVDICDGVTIGAAACVAKNITESGIYVGIPAQKLLKKK